MPTFGCDFGLHCCVRFPFFWGNLHFLAWCASTKHTRSEQPKNQGGMVMRERVEVRNGVDIAKGDGGFRWVSLQKGHQDDFYRWEGDSNNNNVHMVSFFWGWTCANRKVQQDGLSSCAFADFFAEFVLFQWIMFFLGFAGHIFGFGITSQLLGKQRKLGGEFLPNKTTGTVGGCFFVENFCHVWIHI